MHYYISDVACFLMILFLGLIIFIKSNREKTATLFSIQLLCVSLWSLSLSINNDVNIIDHRYINLLSIVYKSSYILGILIISLFLLTSLSISKRNISRILISFLSIFQIIIISITLFTEYIVSSKYIIDYTNRIVFPLGKFSNVFDVYFISLFIYGIFIMHKYSQRNSKNMDVKIVLLYAFIIGFIPPLISCILLPYLNIYKYNYLGPLSALLWAMIISYGIYRHKLFSIRLLIIEASLFFLWFMIASHTLLGISIREIITESVLFTAIIFLGACLLNNLRIQKEQKKMLFRLEEEIRILKAGTE